MTTVAVLADIHGNLPALEAVLAELATIMPDLIVLNGDLADGPFPAETLDLLLSLGERAVWVRGNGDRWLTEAYDGRFRHDDPATERLILWAASRISRAQRDLLSAMPLTRCLDLPDLGRTGFCHATARGDNEMLLVDSPIAHFRDAFAALTGGTIVVGHTHMPFDRLADRRRIVNAGSVGLPYGHLGASWALLGKAVALRRTPYDIEAAASRMLATDMPDVAEFVSANVRTSPSDGEVLEEFQAIERLQQDRACFD